MIVNRIYVKKNEGLEMSCCNKRWDAIEHDQQSGIIKLNTFFQFNEFLFNEFSTIHCDISQFKESCLCIGLFH